MATSLTEYGNQKFRGAIHNLRLKKKAGCRVHEPAHLNDFLNEIERSNGSFDHSQGIERSLPRSLDSFLQRNLSSDLPDHKRNAVSDRALPGQE
jgi:hypothetical protein